MPRRCRGIRGDVGIAPYERTKGAMVKWTAGGVPQGHSFRFAPQRRTPPLHTKYRTAQLCISEQKRQRKEKQRQCNI